MCVCAVIAVRIIEKFYRLIGNPEYPDPDQNVLRLAELHINSTEEMIRDFFRGEIILFFV